MVPTDVDWAVCPEERADAVRPFTLPGGLAILHRGHPTTWGIKLS